MCVLRKRVDSSEVKVVNGEVVRKGKHGNLTTAYYKYSYDMLQPQYNHYLICDLFLEQRFTNFVKYDKHL